MGETGIVGDVEYEAADRNLLIQRTDQEADLNKICTSLITDLSGIFRYDSDFNQDIGNWDVSKVAGISMMFRGAQSFNGNIGNWDVSSVADMEMMFWGALVFNKNLSGWCVTNISSEPHFFSRDSLLTDENKPVWGTCPTT